ncbi:MAG: hypothetical protein WKG01_35705 [Kofleriaceae bacterium]
MRVIAIGLLLMTVVGVRSARADCGTEATALRAHLLEERSRAYTWNSAWAIVYGSLAMIQFGLIAAKTNPFGDFDQDFKESSYVGGTKAGIGFLVRVIRPLELHVPAQHAEPCADVKALRAAVATAGRRERATFWLSIFGGTALNLAGSALLWSRRDFSTAAVSFATGVPAGPIASFTQPRGSWRLWSKHRAEWAAGLDPTPRDGWMLWVATAF